MTSAGDFIDRDRLEQSLSLDAVINYYVLKGLSEDLKRLITFKAGNYVVIGDLEGKPAAERYLDTPNKHGFTALHVAASSGFNDIVRMLIKAGADLQAVTHGGETALYLAVAQGHRDTAQILSDAGAQYEWSIGAGTLCSDNFGASAYKAPREAAAKVETDAAGGGTKVTRSRLYRTVEKHGMRLPGGRPLGTNRLYPQGVQLAGVADRFVAGAAARYPHPGDRVKSDWATSERRLGHKTKARGARWEVYASLNERLLKHERKVPHYMPKWVEQRDLHLQRGTVPKWAADAKDAGGHSITRLKYRGADALHAQKPADRTKADGSPTHIKINAQRLLKKSLQDAGDAHYEKLPAPYQHLVDSMKFRPTMNIIEDEDSDPFLSMGNGVPMGGVNANFGL